MVSQAEVDEVKNAILEAQQSLPDAGQFTSAIASLKRNTRIS